MRPIAPSGLAVARPLQRMLRARPFAGQVVSRFRSVCNLMDAAGRVIALTLPSIGQGPFFIVLDAPAGLFDTLHPYEPVYIDAERIALGSWSISLRQARVWDPTLPSWRLPLPLPPSLAAILQPYADWPRLAPDTPVSRNTARWLAEGVQALKDAVERETDLVAAARQLAGLGPGLTPAGDDYVLGVMAALWILGRRRALPSVAQAVAASTAALSGAFVTAAAQGQFMEGWHRLAHALHQQDEAGTREALQHVAGLGASSGRDALAGFATTLLTLAGCHEHRPLPSSGRAS